MQLLYFRRIMGNSFICPTRSAPALTIKNLHQEDLLKIFSMLPYRDVISLGRTCRWFHLLSQDDLLMKNIAKREMSADCWQINDVYPTREQISVVTSLGSVIENYL